MEAASEWGIPPWQVEEECTEYWWHRLLAWRSEKSKAEERAMKKARRSGTKRGGGGRGMMGSSR